MWIHELLIDVMVHYCKHSDIVSEYTKAFRDAVLLRHVNLFHQTRFEEERAALQINTSEVDNMTSDLFTRPDGLDRDDDDTGFDGDFKDTPVTKRKRQQFETGSKNSRAYATPLPAVELLPTLHSYTSQGAESIIIVEDAGSSASSAGDTEKDAIQIFLFILFFWSLVACPLYTHTRMYYGCTQAVRAVVFFFAAFSVCYA